MLRHLTTVAVLVSLGMHSVWGCGVCRHRAECRSDHDDQHGRAASHHRPAEQHLPPGGHEPREHPKLPGETCVFVKKLSSGDELQDAAAGSLRAIGSLWACAADELHCRNQRSLGRTPGCYRQKAPALAQLGVFLL